MAQKVNIARHRSHWQKVNWAKVGREGIADQGDRTNIMAQSQYGQKVRHASWHKANMGKRYVTHHGIKPIWAKGTRVMA
jgi:hypothetical protein